MRLGKLSGMVLVTEPRTLELVHTRRVCYH